jgi:hypothetical protein
MPILNVINKTIIEAPEYTTGSSDLNLSIPLSSGETISFTAETQFFTPRQIATNRSDVIGIPQEELIQYTAKNIPVVKLPVGAVDITSPQYYPVSIVTDVYQEVQIDNFFQELTDDLEVPDDNSALQTLRDQRDAAMQAAMSLDDLAAAVTSGDPAAVQEANEAINDGLASAIQDEEADPSTVLTPEEADELGALDLVGLTDDYGTTDGAADIIDPTPEVLDEDLIQRLPRVPGKIKGTEIINQAIDLLNSGIQAVEESTQSGVDEDGKCKYITIAKGKKGYRGIGKKKERKVSRADTQKKLDAVLQDIEAQRSSPTTLTETKSGIPTYVKIQKLNIFQRAINGIKQAGVLGVIVGAVVTVATGGVALVAGSTLATAATTGATLGAIGAGGLVATSTAGNILSGGNSVSQSAQARKGYRLMKKEDALKVFERTKEQLEKILAKDCE